MGRKGERFFTSMYKGHMDKTKGGVEAREGGVFGWSRGDWWWVNADNCN